MSRREKLILIWLALAVVAFGTIFVASANNLLTENIPAYGGSLNEGLIGTPRFINPLLATSDTDRDLSALVYSGLLRANGGENFTPDLAESYDISPDGLVYTFSLKPNLKWPDGQELTSSDVLFTVRMAQDPRLKSPARANWEGVTADAPDGRTIRFSLKQAYAPFLQNGTLGILPHHLWKNVKPSEFAFNILNLEALGSGPYQIKKIVKDSSGVPSSIQLKANKNFSLGQPHLSELVFRFYPDEQSLLAAYGRGELSSMAGISIQASRALLAKGNQVLAMPLPRVFGVFFNSSQAGPLSDPAVRQALSLVINREGLVGIALQGFGSPTDSVLGKPGDSNKDSVAETRLAKAISLLEARGWELGAAGIREKKGKQLAFTLSTSDSPDLSRTAAYLVGVWTALGVKLDIKTYEVGDLNTQIIRPRKFEALLFGEVVGRFPDPYAFWHSSQRLDPGLNIGEYTSVSSDKLLQAIRQDTNAASRKNDYKQFEDNITRDIPAIFLYSPDYLYLPDPKVRGYRSAGVDNPADRFLNVYQWYADEDRVWNILVKQNYY